MRLDKKIPWFGFVFTLLFFCVAAKNSLEVATVQLYGTTLEVRFDVGIRQHPGRVVQTEQGFQQAFAKMEKANYAELLDNLKAFKTKYQLNDWLYYQLMSQVLDVVFVSQPTQQALWESFLLAKSGYEVRIAYMSSGTPTVYVWCSETVYEVPLIPDKGKSFVGVSAIKTKGDEKRQSFFLYTPVQKGVMKPFSFSMETLPTLSPQTRNRNIRFPFKDSIVSFDVVFDNTIIDILKEYPILDERVYFRVPMSDVLQRSVREALVPRITGMSEKEVLGFLASFTRSSFRYKEDDISFGKSKPMVSEELLHYPFSDCEDRSALFYRLVKELLGLPMIVLVYPNHISVAVASEELEGTRIMYQNKIYRVCDPTGPVDSWEVGEIPREFRDRKFEVLMSYP